MPIRSHLLSIARHNVRTLRQSPLAELSGSLGDLGTLLPLSIALALQGAIHLPSTLLFSGLANILTGLLFGVPLPVQPMKAIAAIALRQGFSKQETAAAGLTVAFAVLLLSATGLLRCLNHVVPLPVVKGIQVGAGLSLVISAGTSLILPLRWAQPAGDNRILAIAAFLILILATLRPRLPYALLMLLVGLLLTISLPPTHPSAPTHHAAGIWHPTLLAPSPAAWRRGAVDAAIPQLPLTTLNSILAVTSLSASLFPTYPPAPSTTALGFSVATANLIGCWFGAMPVCHGSGGLAGQYRFGARSGASIIILGLVKLLLGLFVGEAVIPLLQRFPRSLLGVMVLAAGVELAKVGQSVGDTTDLWEQADEDNDDGRPVDTDKQRTVREQESRDRWMVMLVTVAGCLAFKNDAVGFLAGLLWHWGLRVPVWMEWWRSERGGIALRHDRRAEDGEGLLDINHDGPEARPD